MLGVTSEMKNDEKHFDYYPESKHAEIIQLVNSGRFDMGIELNGVSLEEFFAVADVGGLMPEKSTYFAPKILSGLFIMQNQVL